MATDHTKNNHNEDYEIDTLTNDRLIKDHEYDGIRELDNDLPPWWKWLFYLCIAFAIVYMIRLWVFHSDDLIQNREYELAMASAAAAQPEKNNAAFEVRILTDPASLAAGKETWTKICSVCHLMDGGGLVGPNMTDNYWIHGNTVQDLYNTVTNGVIEKGMIPYKDQLSEQARLDVISYILVDLQGTTPAIPKAPQGTEY
ncbi:MAG: cbb3-type cytochrome c oxidase N-terminal domain-containing protein [Bacteroidales bacterium]|jgi:cytochrome c oxidase cbb3-type subunit 3|nr:cbb3-type cytochrome c oxidase N-terminal domain-containing protein [Bacteroidales bacterium]